MAATERIARPLRREEAPRQVWRGLLGGAMLLVASLWLLAREGVNVPEWVVPAILFAIGTVMVWSPLEAAVEEDARRPRVSGMFGASSWARVAAGMALVIGTVWWFLAWEFTDNFIVRGIVSPVVVIAAGALVLGPWWLRLFRQASVERQQRIREFERAEIAAHLHDSVLQTLTLIRTNAANPTMVAALARAQERDLRGYLYGSAGDAATSMSAALRQAVAEVEDTRSVVIDVVAVGDTALDDSTRAAVKAAREAAMNAAKHAQAPITVYSEVGGGQATIYVRDGGPGFDPAAVGSDRLGIRRSIVGRMERHGGTAAIASQVGGRTEVTIQAPVQSPADAVSGGAR